jgi:hypothetical protein
LSLVSALVIAAGVAPGRAGQVARGAGAVMSLVLAVAVLGLGRSGGELVYVHGAAQAYASAPVGQDVAEEQRAGEDEDDDDDDERH